MAENEEFDWSANLRLHIYDGNYGKFIQKLVKILGKNSQTEFTERGVDKRPYVIITLETYDVSRALEVHMCRDDVYVPAMGRQGEGFTIFKFDGVTDFGDGSRFVGFGENYTSLTRNLKNDIYKLDFHEFRQAVETLIDDMSANTDNLDNLTTIKWKRRMFVVISALAEAARNEIIAESYKESIETHTTCTTPWMWVQLMFNNWEAISNVASTFDRDICLNDLTKEERDMLFARTVPPTAKDLEANLTKVKDDAKLCRAALSILCGHTKATTPIQATPKRTQGRRKK